MTTRINTGVQSRASLSRQMCLWISFFIPMEARSLCLKEEKCSGILFYHRVLRSCDVVIVLRVANLLFSKIVLYIGLNKTKAKPRTHRRASLMNHHVLAVPRPALKSLNQPPCLSLSPTLRGRLHFHPVWQLKKNEA